ncbi:MAG: hypothetical protein JO093_05225 [Acidobacteria bacterium]|nr:hypothetical protein [Acidobacteriota bacterium]MBV9184997.1 hypothetical protein [Acidobacteriota bacterium]
MTIRRLMIFALLAAMCDARPHSPEKHVASANFFTNRYAHSRFAGWKVHASARGRDCDVLLVETDMVMEDSMVEAMHYGAGAYGVVDGGVQRFYRDRSFRGVAYKDSSGRIWTYGNVTAQDAATLSPCR